MNRSALTLMTLAVCGAMGAQAHARADVEWMVLSTPEVIVLDAPARQHAAHTEFELAAIPEAAAEGWQLTADSATLSHRVESPLCAAQVACRQGVNFTYFQTWVDVPADGFTDLRVRFEDIDDGVRVVVFNSAHPEGYSPRGATVRSQRDERVQVTADLAQAFVAGEANRVVLTHVDDCCGWSVVQNVEILVDEDAAVLAAELEEARAKLKDRAPREGSEGLRR